MLDDKNSFNNDNRNLSDVFRELQEIRNNPQAQQAYVQQSKRQKDIILNLKLNELK